jgi:ketosteroid isomerase-like protein
MAFDRGGLELLRELNALPRWPATASESVRLELAQEESALRAQLATYVYAFDAGDLDAVMSFFADNCLLTNPRGRFVGGDATRANYRELFTRVAGDATSADQRCRPVSLSGQ